MDPSPRRRPITPLSNSRWAAYAAASAATAIACVQSAEADIHYSGILDRKVVNEHATFPLDGGAVMAFHQNGLRGMKIAYPACGIPPTVPSPPIATETASFTFPISLGV